MTMPNDKLFFSFAGSTSRELAAHLQEFYEYVLASATTFLSARDIGGGEPWAVRLLDELEQTNFGILCLTPDNFNEPWLHYEAGALSKQWKESHACCMLFGELQPTQIVGPLALRQHIPFKKDRVLALTRDINGTLTRPVGPQLERLFNDYWDDLETKCIETLSRVSNQSVAPQRTNGDLLSEVLDRVRDIQTQRPPFNVNHAAANSWLELFKNTVMGLPLEDQRLLLDQLNRGNTFSTTRVSPPLQYLIDIIMSSRIGSISDTTLRLSNDGAMLIRSHLSAALRQQ